MILKIAWVFIRYPIYYYFFPVKVSYTSTITIFCQVKIMMDKIF